MELKPAGDTVTKPANPEYFVGTVLMEPIHVTPGGTHTPVASLRVTFLPGGRTNWHTHPAGQTLYVLSGEGRFQTRGARVRRILPGDTIWIPEGEEHWHGAAPHRQMTHIAIQHKVDGITANWLEPVMEADYTAAPS